MHNRQTGHPHMSTPVHTYQKPIYIGDLDHNTHNNFCTPTNLRTRYPDRDPINLGEPLQTWKTVHPHTIKLANQALTTVKNSTIRTQNPVLLSNP